MPDKTKNTINVFEAGLEIMPEGLKPLVYRQAREDVALAVFTMVTYAQLLVKVDELKDYSGKSEKDVLDALCGIGDRIHTLIDSLTDC